MSRCMASKIVGVTLVVASLMFLAFVCLFIFSQIRAQRNALASERYLVGLVRDVAALSSTESEDHVSDFVQSHLENNSDSALDEEVLRLFIASCSHPVEAVQPISIGHSFCAFLITFSDGSAYSVLITIEEDRGWRRIPGSFRIVGIFPQYSNDHGSVHNSRSLGLLPILEVDAQRQDIA